MRKIKLFIASFIGAIALVFACVFSSGVNAETISTPYTVNLFDYSVDEDITDNGTKTSLSKNVNSTSEDVVEFSWSDNTERVCWDASSRGTIGTTRAPRSSDTWLKVTIPSGYYVSSFILNGIAEGSRTAFLASTATDSTSSALADTTTLALNKKTASEGELIATGKRLDASSASLDLYINCDNKFSIYAITITLEVDSESGSETPEVTVTAIQQEAVVGSVTYLRFVFIVSNDTTLTSANFANKLTLILDEGETTEQTKTCSPKAYDKLTLGGNTYTATVKGASYSFDNSINTNDIYVVYVVGFTTANYTGHNVKASLNVNSTEYPTSGYDF